MNSYWEDVLKILPPTVTQSQITELVKGLIKSDLTYHKDDIPRRLEIEEAAVFGEFDTKEKFDKKVDSIRKRAIHSGIIAKMLSNIIGLENTLEDPEKEAEIILDSLSELEHCLTPYEFSIFNPIIGKLRDSTLINLIVSKVPEKSSGKSCVYIMQFENDSVKIGISSNLQQRKLTLISGSGMNITKLVHSDYMKTDDARKIEKTCHKKFDADRLKGEFFKISFEDACEELKKYCVITEVAVIN